MIEKVFSGNEGKGTADFGKELTFVLAGDFMICAVSLLGK
jgi:hypothetical protein